MEMHTKRIMRFSKAVYILLQIAFWALAAVFVFFALAYILKLTNPYIGDSVLGAKITLTEGRQTEFTLVILPEFTFEGYGMNFAVTIANIFEYVATLIVVACAKRVFKTLRADGNPFRAEVVRGFKRLVVALLIVGVFGGVIGFIGAATVAVICMIFDCGTALQQE